LSPIDPGLASEGGNGFEELPGVTLCSGLKSTVPELNSRVAFGRSVATLAPGAEYANLGDQLRPNASALPLSVVSVSIYQTLSPLPRICPWYSGRVIVDSLMLRVPDLNSWRGPTSSFCTEEGAGPK
jgi:hypothetical protein